MTFFPIRLSNQRMRSYRNARELVAAAALVLAGCSDTAAPPSPASVNATGGAGQIGPVNSLLPEPIVATVLDAGGQPVQGVRVTWSADGDGHMAASTNVTDAQGQATARWVLGGLVGPSRATAAVPDLQPATFTAIAEPAGQVPFGPAKPLDIPTYEGSRQVVHPDYAFAAGSVPHHHLAITPYPYGDASHENPSHFVGERGDRFALPAGGPNPVVRPKAGYLSDPDVVYLDATGELWMYYREVTSSNIIQLVRTTDGSQWSAPQEVVRAPNHQIVSPTVVRRGDGDWLMWAVNAGERGCSAPATSVDVRRSADGLHWSAPEPVNLPGPFPWHIEVQWIPSRGEFWAVYNVKSPDDCATAALYLATSPDGVTWTVLDQPVLTRGRIPELNDIVYRSTFQYDPIADAITFWYSGATFSQHERKYVWGAAVERRLRTDVFAPAAAVRAGPPDWGEPPVKLYEGP